MWIAEDADPNASLMLTGRFSGYRDRDGRMEGRFEDLEAGAAIAWGRARAATVLIRTGDSGCYFSAGEHNPDRQEYLVWDPAGLRLDRRRPRGFEALDNTESDPPVLWDVRVGADPFQSAEADPFHKAIRSHPAVHSAQTPAPGYPAPSAAFLVEASTHKQAQQIADGILEKAFGALVQAHPRSEGSYLTYGSEVYPHRPGRPAKGPGVTY